MPAQEGGTTFVNGSLYVGDLSPEVNEPMLYEIFSAIGPVSSIRVCRDSLTRKSLRYAYINFHDQDDANKAMERLNHISFMGQPIRIMSVQRDPAARRSGNGNVFVKNLDKEVSNKTLTETFAPYGVILSSKIMVDEFGKSLGFGFVQYETEESAKKAIDELNGKVLNGKAIYAGPFVKRSERPNGMDDHYTNIYLRGFPMEWGDDEIMNVCSEFGTITSIAIKVDPARNKKFAFVNFELSDSAKTAFAQLNGKVIDDDSTLYVAPFQNKARRSQLLKNQHQQNLNEKRSKFQGLNLYVKNLDETVDDDKLRQLFEPFGTITSSKIMVDDKGFSRGFGFVCFENSDDATHAVTAMHQKNINGKPLYVGLAERREQRSHRLQQRLRPTYYNQAGNASGGGSYQNNSTGSFQMQGSQGAVQYGYPQRNRTVVTPPYPSNIISPWNRQNQNGQFNRGNLVNFDNQRRTGKNTRNNQTKNSQQGSFNFMQMKQNDNNNAFKFTSQARNRTGHLPNQVLNKTQTTDIKSSDIPLTAAALAAAQPSMQKQMLGEKLFPSIALIQPELAGKITGMMLEMDNSELLILLENEVQLKAKVDEALRVLKQAE